MIHTYTRIEMLDVRRLNYDLNDT